MILSEATLALLASHGDPTALDALLHLDRGASYALTAEGRIWIVM
jgi:hypothetical protein